MLQKKTGGMSRMRRLSMGASLLVMGLCATPAFAQATDEGAKAIQGRLAQYFSQAAFDSGVLSVTAEGDSYKLKVDLSVVSQAAAAKGDEFTFAAMEYDLTENSDGTYGVTSDSPFQVGVKVTKGEAVDFRMALDECESKGTFDPKLGYFSDLTSDCAKGNFTMRSEEQDVDATFGEIKTLTKSVAADGGTTITTTADMADITETITMKREGVSFGVKAESAQQEVVMQGGRITNILDLVAFLVQTGGPEKAIAAQPEIKEKVMAALPLWVNFGGKIVFKNAEVSTPVGVLKMATFEESANIAGATKDAAFTLGLKMDGLELPAGVVPAWAASLVPKSGNLDVKFDGVDLESIARLAVEKFDATQNPPIPNEVTGQFMQMIMANPPKVTLSPSTFTADVASVGAEGSMTVFPSQVGAVTVTATGIDAVVDAINKSDLPDKEQTLMGISMAKGLGKAGADGSTSWVIDFDIGSKKVLINGQPIPMP